MLRPLGGRQYPHTIASKQAQPSYFKVGVLLRISNQRNLGLLLGFLLSRANDTSAAISKLIATGITWPSGKHLWMWINEKAVDEIARSGFVELNIVQEAAMASFFVATLFLAFGLIAEALAWLVWYKKTRMLLMLGILALHIGIWMTMDILFALSVYELLILTFPWAVWIDRFLDKRGST